MTSINTICLLGFGEVGQALGDALKKYGGAITAWDIKFNNPASAPAHALIGNMINAGSDAADATANADLIISAVTAEQTLSAAKSVAGHCPANAYYFDMNSASPAVKINAAEIITEAGGRYIDAAVIAPFSPQRLAAPMLLGGPHVTEFLSDAADLGFSGSVFFDEAYGKAAAAKMCRSVMIKGMEALLIESLMTARHYGVEESVISSLSNLFPGPNWQTLSHYMISRALLHGTRRAEEMREVAVTVEDAGVAPHMSSACASRQSWAAQFGDAASEVELTHMLDKLLRAKSKDEGASSC